MITFQGMKTCEYCGVSFSPKYHALAARFCSKRCSATKQHAEVSPESRFWSHVVKGDGCWEWSGGKDLDGYGAFSVKGRAVRAHRFSYILFKGAIPSGRVVMHSCDNPSCVRPEHLSVGTSAENTLDAKRKGRLASGERNGARLHPERLRRGPMPPRDPTTRPRGEGHSNSVLTDDMVRRIREMAAAGMVQRRIAETLNISNATVCLVVNGKIWKHVA